jgi:hypothetical protein
MPLVLFDDDARALSFAPLSDFFVAVHETTSSAHDLVLRAGPMASVRHIPAGYEYSTVLRADSSVRGALSAVGATLLRNGGKTPVELAAGESVIKYKSPLNVLTDTYDHSSY